MSTYVVRPTPEIWHQPGYIILEMAGDRVVQNMPGIYPTRGMAAVEAEYLNQQARA